MMLNDEDVIEIMAKRADEECGFSQLSNVLNHYSWVDVFTYLYLEKGLRPALLEAYQREIDAAREAEAEEMYRSATRASAYAEWKADVATRGGA